MSERNGETGGDRAAQRAAVVREFLAQEHRTAASARAGADRLGMSRSNFYRLARAYDANLAELTKHGRTGVPQLQKGTERQISLVLDRIGVEGRVADAHALVDLACQRIGLNTPAKDVVRKRMLERRRVSGMALAGSRLQFDETGLGMALTIESTTVLPALSLILHATSGRVVAHRLDPAPHDGVILRLVDAVGLPEDIELGRPRLKGGSAAAVFGDRLGPFLLRPRAAGRPPSKHYTFETGLDEARRIVGGLIDEHNAQRPQI